MEETEQRKQVKQLYKQYDDFKIKKEMTEKEYLEKRKEIDKQYKRSISDLEMEYCLGKTLYGVGDIVQDHIGAVLITEVTNSVWHTLYDRDNKNISLVFKGIDVRKSDLEPKKNGGERDVFEYNIKKSVEEECARIIYKDKCVTIVASKVVFRACVL